MLMVLVPTGSSTERGTEGIAASWKTQSTPLHASASAAAFMMESLRKSSAVSAAMLPARPVERSSMPRTLSPRASNARAMLEPMKPATPVMRYVRIYLLIGSRIGAITNYALRLLPLAAHNVGRRDALGGVARIHHQLCLFDDCAVVVIGVVRDDEDAVVLRQVIERRAFHLQIVVTPAAHKRKVRIVVTQLHSLVL